ncbi:hypothetical protein IFM89_039145 [Coptis chinensis]|uniref:Uncharacterized protein n=1 Tax=Coptis chinensis TaxID=261450 RepID=A0A835LQQ1_9MAGN|nr:hypothetical protein IFM89_039145 [Coptis chinensis]
MSTLDSALASFSRIPRGAKWSQIECEYIDVTQIFDKIKQNDGYFTDYTSKYVVPSIKLLDMPKDPNIKDKKVKLEKILLIFHQQHLQMEFHQNQSTFIDLVEHYRKNIPTNCFCINKYNIMFNRSHGALNTTKHLWCGAIAATVSRTIVAPLERLKLEYIVLGEKKNYVSSSRQMEFQELYSTAVGITATILCSPKQMELGPMGTLLYGAIVGTCAEASTYPFEVVRRQLQMQVQAIK